MKSRIVSLMAMLALACTLAFAADVDGKWMAEAQDERAKHCSGSQ